VNNNTTDANTIGKSAIESKQHAVIQYGRLKVQTASAGVVDVTPMLEERFNKTRAANINHTDR